MLSGIFLTKLNAILGVEESRIDVERNAEGVQEVRCPQFSDLDEEIPILSIVTISVSEPEPEPPGAAFFGWSRSRSRKNYAVSAPAPAPL